MEKKIVLLGIVVAIVSFIGASYYFNKQWTLNGFNYVKDQLTTKLQPVTSTWNSFPNWLKPIIPTVTLGAVGLFFAWAKMQWQKKAQQMEAEVTQVSGAKTEVEKQLSQSVDNTMSLQEQLDATKEKLKLYQDIYETNRQMTQKVNAIPQEITNLETRFQGDVSTVIGKIRDLERKIEESKKVT